MPAPLPLDRRCFLGAVGAAVAGSAVAPSLHAAETPEPTPQPFRKAVKIGMVRAGQTLEEKFRILKELGFDGVELDAPSDRTTDEVLRARDATGLVVHGVVDSVHWKPTHVLSSPDPAVRRAGVEQLQAAIRAAHSYGATSVLLVPAVVNKEVSYAEAYTRSQAAIREALPLAGELKIHILIENVWNNFLLSPMEMARYLDELESPWMGSYFDVGNIVLYGWPEQWIRTLGKRIKKLDIKEYSREVAQTQGTRKGFGVELLEGDCDWPSVLAALREIGFEGWGTAEIPGGDRDRLAEIARRMNRIFAS